jgi:DMSO/TMAO reductase YedYZ molybdopterin-dependent catalytic subunit
MPLPLEPLPPGQYEHPSFDRFGLGLFAKRFPQNSQAVQIEIRGDIKTPATMTNDLDSLQKVEQLADFHCVTSWSVRSLRWSGVRFKDFYQQLIIPTAIPDPDATVVVFRGQDGYACCMQLEDLLADDVMLASQLNGEPLGIEHGAPLRLVAPAHYGYKNVKHLCAIEFWRDRRNYRFPFPYPAFMDHPRARVALEERASLLPLWLIKPIYRMLMPFARRKSQRALKAYRAKTNPQP